MRLDATAPLDDPADPLARRARLAAVAEQVRPIMLAQEQTLPLVAPLVPLFPEGALRRGITIAVHGDGATSLALALAAAPVRAGSWVALVDVPECNLTAAAEAGVALERLACIDAGDQWAPAVAALLGAVDLVVVGCPRRVRPADARRLAARARERGAVIVALAAGGRGATWPDAPDLQLRATGSRWSGLGAGHGHLRGRVVEVCTEGRRGFARPRRAEVAFPLDVPSVGAPAAPVDGLPVGAPAAPGVRSHPAWAGAAPAPVEAVARAG